jgi:hypothetical protein
MPQDRSQMFSLTSSGFAHEQQSGTEYVAAAPPTASAFRRRGRDIYYTPVR